MNKTIEKTVSFQGIGLHTGKLIKMTLSPGNNGIEFKQVQGDWVKLNPNLVSNTTNNTTVDINNSKIHTIEHFMFALYCLKINNIRCIIDGPEIPIMDGSASSFLFILKEAGIKNLKSPREKLIVKEEFTLQKDNSIIKVKPSEKFKLNVNIKFPHPKIGTQTLCVTEEDFKNIARARTFGFLKQAEELQRKGLIKGASLNNAVILDDYNVINVEGLRDPKEFVWHKALDLIGDIALVGKDIQAEITAFRPSHSINNELARKLYQL